MLTIIDYQNTIPGAAKARVVEFLKDTSTDTIERTIRDISTYGDDPLNLNIGLAEVHRLEVGSSSATLITADEDADGSAYPSSIVIVELLDDLPGEWSAAAWETLRGLEASCRTRCVHTFGPHFLELYKTATNPAAKMPCFPICEGKLNSSEHLRFGSNYRLHVELAVRREAYLHELSKFAVERRLFGMLHLFEQEAASTLVRILRQGGKAACAEAAEWLRGEFQKNGLDPDKLVFA